MLRVACAAGKGFGPAEEESRRFKGGKQAKQAGLKSGDSKAVHRAVKLVEDQEARQQQQQQRGLSARPIDPREASRGKVEYVRVKDWGSGAPDDLGSLQVKEPPTQAFAADGAGADAMPFHEALARRLELLQSQGALGVAKLPGSKPLPPFERWAFAEEHYVQYLADLYAVHADLERSVAQAAAALGSASPAAAASPSPLLCALRLFGPEQGLDRAGALLRDLQRIVARSQQQEQQRAAAAAGYGEDYAPPAPTQHAAALAAYLASLARLCRAAEGPAEEEQATLRLLANAYVLHLMHQTSGGRVAAAAASKLGLDAAGALAFHREYPCLPEGVEPLDRLVANTNELGRLLSAGQQEALMQELAKAMTKGSMLLVPLAREA